MHGDLIYQTVVWNGEGERREQVQIRYPILGTEEDEEVVRDIKGMMESLLLDMLENVYGEGGSDGEA